MLLENKDCNRTIVILISAHLEEVLKIGILAYLCLLERYTVWSIARRVSQHMGQEGQEVKMSKEHIVGKPTVPPDKGYL